MSFSIQSIFSLSPEASSSALPNASTSWSDSLMRRQSQTQTCFEVNGRRIPVGRWNEMTDMKKSLVTKIVCEESKPLADEPEELNDSEESSVDQLLADFEEIHDHKKQEDQDPILEPSIDLKVVQRILNAAMPVILPSVGESTLDPSLPVVELPLSHSIEEAAPLKLEDQKEEELPVTTEPEKPVVSSAPSSTISSQEISTENQEKALACLLVPGVLITLVHGVYGTPTTEEILNGADIHTQLRLIVFVIYMLGLLGATYYGRKDSQEKLGTQY